MERPLADLLRLVRGLTRKGVTVHFHNERLIFNGDDSPLQNLLFQVVGACVEFERSLIRERRRELIDGLGWFIVGFLIALLPLIEFCGGWNEYRQSIYQRFARLFSKF